MFYIHFLVETCIYDINFVFLSSWNIRLQECWPCNPIEFLLSDWLTWLTTNSEKLCAYFLASSKWQRYSYAMCSFLFSSIKSASICLWSARKERRENQWRLSKQWQLRQHSLEPPVSLSVTPESRGSVTKLWSSQVIFCSCHVSSVVATPTVSPQTYTRANSTSFNS